MAKAHSLDIGLWFPRPERGATLAQHLRRRGHRVTTYHVLPVPDDPAWVVHVGRGFFGGLRVLRHLSHDVLFTSQAFVPVLQLLANKRLTSRPFVFNSNGPIWGRWSSWSLSRPKALLYPALLKMVVAGADAVVGNSRFLAEELRARYPSQSSKVHAIYNGIDYEAIDSGKPSPDIWPSGAVRALSVVSLDFERKTDGFMLLLDAFDALSERRSDLSYLIAAKSANPTTTARVRERIGRLARPDQVRLDFNRTDIPDLLATADLFLYATPANSSDSLPRVLLEAQAAGVPTVTTATTGCGEVVLDGETGRAVPYAAAAVADAASQLLSDTDLSSRMAARGKQSVWRRFRWESMADQYEELFLRIAVPRS